jgi:hypothetical protein
LKYLYLLLYFDLFIFCIEKNTLLIKFYVLMLLININNYIYDLIYKYEILLLFLFFYYLFLLLFICYFYIYILLVNSIIKIKNIKYTLKL